MMKKHAAIVMAFIALGTPNGAQTAERDEAALIAVLKSDAGREQKDAACRELVTMGSAKAIPALAALLGDAELSHMARYALEPMPYPAVDMALRAALDEVRGRLLVGVIGSVGARRDAAAIGQLASFLGSGDAAVREAAARALGRIGTPPAAQALGTALGAVPAASRPAIIEGLLRCAEALHNGGDRDGAAAVYRRLGTLTDAPHQVRAAVLRGSVLTAGAAGLPLLVDALGSEDYPLVQVAAVTAQTLPGPDTTRALASALDTLPSDAQVLLAHALGKREDPAALASLTALARKGDSGARIAAIHALAEIGDASATTALDQLQRDPSAEVVRVARAALTAQPGTEVDTLLAAMLRDPQPEQRRAAVHLLGERRTTGALPALWRTATDEDEAVRLAGIEVLGQLGNSDTVSPLTELLLRADSPPTRAAVEKALQAVSRRLAQPDPSRVEILLAQYGDLPDGQSKDVAPAVKAMVDRGELTIAGTNGNFGDTAPGIPKQFRMDYRVDGVRTSETVREGQSIEIQAAAPPRAVTDTLADGLTRASSEAKPALLRLLRADGSTRALAAVRGAAEDPDPAVRSAAENMLCAWPTAEALPDLLQLARTAETPRTRILALRACCRLIPHQQAPADQKLAQLQQVLALAERPDEKRPALAALADIHAVEALEVAVSFLDDAALSEEAAVAAVALGEALGATHPRQVSAAMTRVLETSRNDSTKGRAQVTFDETGETR